MEGKGEHLERGKKGGGRFRGVEGEGEHEGRGERGGVWQSGSKGGSVLGFAAISLTCDR